MNPNVRPAIPGQDLFGRVRQILIAARELPRRRDIQPAQDVEQRRLAAAGRAEQDDQLAAMELEVHAAKRAHQDVAHAIRLDEPPVRGWPGSGRPSRLRSSSSPRIASCQPTTIASDR
jgi:hypothetical protein